MKNMANLVSHQMGRALQPPLNTIKRPNSASPKTHRIYSKKGIQKEAFNFKKHPRVKFLS